MPRVKSDAERGYIGVWMRHERMSRGWAPERVVDELASRGQRIRVDYYRALEAGKKPGPELLTALRDLYGNEPEPLPVPAPESDPIAAAIRELTAEVRLSRQEQRQSVAFLTDLLGVVARIAGGEEALSQISDAVRAQTPASPD